MLAVNSNEPALNAWQSAHASEPAASGDVQLNGACALLAVLLESQTANQSASREEIDFNHTRQEELRAQMAEAVRAAQEAAESGGCFGFLGDVFGSDIGQIAGAVALLAATVATGGTAAALIAVAVAAALQVAAKVGPELGLPKEVCIGLALASVAVGFASGAGAAGATSQLANIARTVGTSAKVVEAGATILGGVCTGVAGYYHGQQLDHQAREVGLQGQSTSVDVDIDDAIAELSRSLSTQQKQISTATEMIDGNADANLAISQRI